MAWSPLKRTSGNVGICSLFTHILRSSGPGLIRRRYRGGGWKTRKNSAQRPRDSLAGPYGCSTSRTKHLQAHDDRVPQQTYILRAMGSSLVPMASFLVAMASTLVATASKLLAMACNQYLLLRNFSPSALHEVCPLSPISSMIPSTNLTNFGDRNSARESKPASTTLLSWDLKAIFGEHEYTVYI